VVPLLALLAAMLFLFLPKTTKVPDVIGSASAFAAEKTVTESGLTLNPTRTEKPVSDPKQVGTVLDQTPKPGEKATKGKTQVSIVVGVGDGKIEVPNIVGKNLDEAEKALRDKGLTVGKSSIQPPDPKAPIASQIPAAREVVKQGTPVDIFYPDPKAVADAKKKDKNAAKNGAAAVAAAGAGAGAADIIVPAIADQKVDAYAAAIGKLKLVPKIQKKFDNSPKGTLFATDPVGGTKVKSGSSVTLLVSAGFPEVAYDDDKNVLLLDGASGKKLPPIAKGTEQEQDPTWSFDGTQVAFQSDGQVFLKDMTSQKAAIPLSDPSDFFKDLSWAPTGDTNVLAMLRAPKDPNSKDLSTLCFGQITAKGMEAPSCLDAPKGIELDRTINWAPNGKSLLIFGFEVDQNFTPTGSFGMVRYRSKKPFSPDKADWSGGKFITDHSQSGKGVLDAAISPDGKHMAVVAAFGNAQPPQFKVSIVKPNDPLLQQPRALNVTACRAIWSPDSAELLVVQSDDCNQQPVGALVRVPVNDPQDQRQLKLNGDNPSYQPLTISQ
jgi:beta-lactam-binding protein with PASTA domain